MRTTPFALMLALTLAACSSTPEAPSAKAAAAAPATGSGARDADSERLTGSRLARQSSDRTVRSVGADSARTDMSEVRSLGNSIGSRGN